jgi:predicted TPR repeat methyltransferase
MSKPECLVCAASEIEQVLDLGKTVPANSFLRPGDIGAGSEEWFALRVGVCGTCGHVQLLDHVPPTLLFDHYSYVSSASSTLTEHLHGLAREVVARLALPSTALVVDVGCNDGTLLDGFCRAGIDRRVGVDPAANLAARSSALGASVNVGYFTEELAARLRRGYGPAAVLTMTNTFPHIPDLHALMRAIGRLLADDGVFVLEAHYLADLLELGAFDTIYHEHVSYWSLLPMQQLFSAHGFEVFDVERLPIHHGQLRAWVCRTGTRAVAPRVAALADFERESQLGSPATLRALTPRIEAIRRDLLGLMADVRRRGGRVAAYGAPAKGSTLLSYFGLGPGDLDYIADRNPLKQGRVTPGSHVPIVAPGRILEDPPDLLVVLAWNFADEIARQLEPYLHAGGRMVVPIPKLEVLEARA